MNVRKAPNHQLLKELKSLIAPCGCQVIKDICIVDKVR